MNKLLLLALLCLSLTACYSTNDAEKALTAAGFTDINVTGPAPFSCSDGDTFKTGFTARNPKGEVVSGAVCSGWLKGATIRF